MSRMKQTIDSERSDDLTEHGIDSAREVAVEQQQREQKFKRDNAEGFAWMNAWVEKHGLPLGKYRQF